MSTGFLVKEGFSGLVRAKFPSFAAILSIAISLTLLGGAYVAGTEVYQIIKEVKSQFQVEVFLLPSATDSNKKAVASTLKDFTGVASYSFISKDKAAERFKQEFGEDINIALGTNPLPESYTVQMDDAHQNYDDITKLVNKVSKLPGVDEVQYRRGFLRVIERYFRAIAIAGIVILLLVLGATIMLVGNTIKLSIFAKRDVIRIMKLVGATNRFIRTPFIIEGVIQGIIGAAIAVVLLYILIQGTDFLLQGLYSVQLQFDYTLLAGVGIAGVLFGFIGSMRSIRLFLNKQQVY